MTRFIVPDEPTSQPTSSPMPLDCNGFAARPGHVRTQLGRALDDPSRWVLVSEWTGVGPWRRALSAYDVRVEAMPLMELAENEPAVYENPMVSDE